MSIEVEQAGQDTTDYGAQYQPKRTVKVIKKDGSKEVFNVQKVINAVGKSAYRALTKFTEEEKRHICEDVIGKVNEMGLEEIGERLNLSRERVRQIKEKALNILRSAQIGNVLKEYL